MMKGILRKVLLVAVLVAVLAAFGTCEAADMRVPILMYHDITDDAAQLNSMRVTNERFRLDMEFLQQFGYTPLLPADLIAINSGEQAMPEKPVMITFDDGYRSNYDIAYPVMQQTGMRGVVAVVAFNIRPEGDTDPLRGSMTWDELREMSQSGVFEIGSHTYNLHNPEYHGMSAPDGINGVMRRRGESKSEYASRVGIDLRTSLSLIREHTGQASVNYFSYPFGAHDRWMQPLLEQEGIRVSTLTNQGTARISGSLYSLPRYRISMDQPLSALLRQSSRAEPALANVSVNGSAAVLPAYNIDGSNYVRVRDVAVLLRDTAGGFDVQWDSASRRVVLIPMAAYEPIGTESAPLSGSVRSVRPVSEPTVADGTAHMIAAYNIDGCTFYKLRSLGELCHFAVDWDSASQTVVVTV